MRITVIMLFVSFCTLAQDIRPFDNEQQRQLFNQLTEELRCPQCQNQNIADSNAIVAVDMREKTYQLVREGKDRAQVLDYMIGRYGDFVHYQPPVNRFTLWLWLAPLLMLVLLLVVGAYRRASKNNDGELAANTPSASELDTLIDRYRSKKP